MAIWSSGDPESWSSEFLTLWKIEKVRADRGNQASFGGEYTYTYTYKYTYAYMYMYSTYIHVHICMCMYVHISLCICVYVYVYMCICVCVFRMFIEFIFFARAWTFRVPLVLGNKTGKVTSNNPAGPLAFAFLPSEPR